MQDPRDDGTPDPHLRAALRHAPDRDAAPPPDLSERIRREAHVAVRPSSTGGAGRWLQALLDRLTRPAWAGALGTVAIAGVIGLLWRDGVPPEPAPVEAPPAASREAKVEAPPVAAERAAEPAAPPPVAAPPVQRKAAPAPPPPAPPPPPPAAAADESRAEPRARIAAERARQAAPAAMAPAAPAAPPDPLAAPLAALADGPAGVRERLRELQRRHAGQWQSVEPLAPDQGEVIVDAAGRILGRLWIDERAITWQPPVGRAWRAPL